MPPCWMPVSDLAGVVRQGKIAVRLHEQQCETPQEADRPVPGQLLKIFVMVRFSLRVNVARGIFTRMASIGAPRGINPLHLDYLLRL